MKHQTFIELLIEIRNLILLKKEVLSIDEVALYTGFEKSYLFKLTSNRKIPHFKPNGKKLFFKRIEIDEWLTQNEVKTNVKIYGDAQKVSENINNIRKIVKQI